MEGRIKGIKSGRNRRGKIEDKKKKPRPTLVYAHIAELGKNRRAIYQGCYHMSLLDPTTLRATQTGKKGTGTGGGRGGELRTRGP